MKKTLDNVGYFGIEGSFTHSAALAYFGQKKPLVPLASFEEIFRRVRTGTIAYGIVPIENTLAGSLYDNYDLLDKYDLSIVGEITCKVEHCLLVTPGSKASAETDYKSLKSIYSHSKALEQCSLFLEQHPWIEAIPYLDTANAARFVGQQNDPSLGAIASGRNAELSGLKIVKEHIENNKYNFTRFLIIAAKHMTDKHDADKCSLVARLPHVTGSLSQVLNLLMYWQCNLTKIESRPIPGHPFEYVFYLDFLFSAEKYDIQDIVDAVRAKTDALRTLGVYKSESTRFAEANQ